MSRRFSSAFEALGYTASVERLYWKVLGLSGVPLAAAASALLRTPEQLLEDLGPLAVDGVVRVEGGRLVVLSPAGAFTHLLEREAGAAAHVGRRLSELASAIPYVSRSMVAKAGDPLEGEVFGGEAGDVPDLFRGWIEETQGDMLWMRPDQWRMEHESTLAAMVAGAIANGRRSRAIYPVRALTEAREHLEARAVAGEQIRVAAEVPTRLAIMGTQHALIPETMGFATDKRLIVRQPGLVQALTNLFELLWDRAAAVPGLDRGEARPDLRRLLLMQLADGAKDEQIARTLGISLRTVRRRIADLLIELGVDSRFQAGAEAVRHGWL
jgi:hypothetical protein